MHTIEEAKKLICPIPEIMTEYSIDHETGNRYPDTYSYEKNCIADKCVLWVRKERNLFEDNNKGRCGLVHV